MKYLWTMVEISLVSNIHFPGKWHRPHLPANPGELPHNFQVSAEQYGPLSRCCHSPLKLHLVKSRAVQEKEKNSPPSPPQRKPATTLVFPRLSYRGPGGGPGDLERFLIQGFKTMTISSMIRNVTGEMAALLFRNFLIP